MPQSLEKLITPAQRPEELRERELLDVVATLVRELHPGRSRFVEISLSSRLERDLGIDSLARTELMSRAERAFRVRLPVTVIGEAETVADLLHALAGSSVEGGLDQPKTTMISELPLVPAAIEARTLIEVLDWHVAQHPDRIHLTVLQDDTTALGTMTYADLATSGRAVAASLIAGDILPGDRVGLMLPTGLDFFAAFCGILYAGAVPVPIYPPMRLSQIEDHLRRQAGILRNAAARMLITVAEGRRFALLLRAHVDSLGAIESVANLKSAPVRALKTCSHAVSHPLILPRSSCSCASTSYIMLKIS